MYQLFINITIKRHVVGALLSMVLYKFSKQCEEEKILQQKMLYGIKTPGCNLLMAHCTEGTCVYYTPSGIVRVGIPMLL